MIKAFFYLQKNVAFNDLGEVGCLLKCVCYALARTCVVCTPLYLGVENRIFFLRVVILIQSPASCWRRWHEKESCRMCILVSPPAPAIDYCDVNQNAS